MTNDARTQWLSQRRLETLLSVLEDAPPLGALTLLVAPGGFRPTDQQRVRWLEEVRAVAPPRIWQSETGVVIFWSDEIRLAIEPPFPLETTTPRIGFRTAALRALLHRDPLFGVVLLRLGSYSVGVFQGRNLVDAKTGARYVKGRHSAGGTSQRRFSRVREKQIHHLYVKVCDLVRQKFEPYEKKLERIFLGGERHTLSGFVKQCPFLQRLKPLIADRILPVHEPRRRELDRMPDEVWKSRVTVFRLPEWFPFDGL